ncbi:hypothetical protein KA107_00090 [Candidatus Pacearchaeota archaeon]|nr:hypothetical protein [Candidatus Pacearchaeota archaeon]
MAETKTKKASPKISPSRAIVSEKYLESRFDLLGTSFYACYGRFCFTDITRTPKLVDVFIIKDFKDYFYNRGIINSLGYDTLVFDGTLMGLAKALEPEHPYRKLLEASLAPYSAAVEEERKDVK